MQNCFYIWIFLCGHMWSLLFIEVNTCTWLYINKFHFDCAMICIVVNTNYTTLSIQTYFGIEVIYLEILFFKILINLSATTNFHPLCAEYISISLSWNQDFIDLLQNSLALATHISLGFQSNSFWLYLHHFFFHASLL